MANENDFYNVLKDIAMSLREISEGLKSIGRENAERTKTMAMESRARIRNERRRLLQEGKVSQTQKVVVAD